MRALITGITGFAGGHLAELLAEQGDEVIGCDRRGDWPAPLAHLAGKARLASCDITDAAALTALLRDCCPDAVYHLAAVAEPAACGRDPDLAHRVNVEGTRNLLEAVLRLAAPVRILYVSTSHVYGQPAPEDIPLKESAPLQSSDHPYAATKLEADRLSRRYAQEQGLDVIVVRPFNHTGPRRPRGYAISSWASQIAAIEAGRQPPVVQVGNLGSRRDYSDVRDVVRAYRLAVEHAAAGDVFNVGSGVARRTGDILDQLIAMSEKNIEVTVDPALLRPNDPGVIVADAARLRARTGWQPHIAFEETLRDILEDWRRREGNEP